MLKQDAVPEPPASASPTPVGQARVTPDELAKALAAIEARRAAEAAHLAGTIPIDQAVSELHLDSSSDEIWAKVQKQRSKAAAAEAAKQQKESPSQALPFQAGSSVRPQLQRNKQAGKPRGWRRFAAPILVIGVLMGTGVIPHSFTPHGFSPSLLTRKRVSNDTPILRPFSQIPDGTEVYADDTALAQISKDIPATQVAVSRNPSGSRWTLVKMHDHVYLHGFTASADSLAALDGKALAVYNDDNSGELSGQGTSRSILRVDGVPLQKSGGDSEYSSIAIPNFQHDPFTTLTPGR